jgi:hypothetical protein
MAGVKITDLGTLATAASDDLLYIVDVSDTSQSPQGTSKQIEVGNLLDFESGTWTPTFSNFSDAITAATLTEAKYQRVGSIVTASIWLSITFDFTVDTAGSCEFTYPFATTSPYGSGTLGTSTESKQLNGCVRNNSILLLSEDTSLDSAGTFHVIFQYEILS